MSKLATGASFQLKLAFADEDLKHPTHDKIMFWLSKRVEDPAIGRQFLPTLPLERVAAITHMPDNETLAGLRSDGLHLHHHFQTGDHSSSSETVDAHWPNEPAMAFEFKRLRWEAPLTEKERTVAFADLEAEYEYGRTLIGRTTHLYSGLRTPRPGGHGASWKYEKSGETFEFEQSVRRCRIFFEVKTAIKSVGDLMRQLNFYRQLEQLRGRSDGGLRPRLVVVAPFHEEAAAVCKAHGYGFVAYRPSSEEFAQV
ncbi:MAG TPA: hypothetical protein VG407_15910 [Caulobacteraceae bacterium]|jgi:hypothetical protein|nr:hypothetical protein [Caulobacteraceae bacterium]